MLLEWIPRELKQLRGRPPDYWGSGIAIVARENWKRGFQDQFEWEKFGGGT